jgi:hypothetical protein
VACAEGILPIGDTHNGPDGPRVKQAKVMNVPLALAQYFASFPGPHKAVVESTGGWYWLADTLAPLGVELVLAHATRLKAISAAKVKTGAEADAGIAFSAAGAFLFAGGEKLGKFAPHQVVNALVDWVNKRYRLEFKGEET